MQCISLMDHYEGVRLSINLFPKFRTSKMDILLKTLVSTPLDQIDTRQALKVSIINEKRK
jgi:hypothetical protein